MIAALHGRSGKTVLTLGLLRSLRNRGIAAQPFKKGPDFIDPGWHTVAAGRASRNLDSFFMTPSQICATIRELASDCPRLNIIEGAMGFYDGLDVNGSSSSAEIAKITQSPVILVVDVTRMTRTTAALIMGCQRFDPEVGIGGVILNRVRGPRQEDLIRTSIETYCHVPVIGAVPYNEKMTIPDRHLGLLSSTEAKKREQTLDGIAEIVGRYVDLDAVCDLANSAGPLGFALHNDSGVRAAEPLPQASPQAKSAQKEKPRIAVIRDPAFCFYYQENLDALMWQGAELAYVDSLRDAALPANIGALYIGGGFPESFAAQLQANGDFLASIREHAERGLPIYAECAGLMLLSRTLTCQTGIYRMAGILQMDTVMQRQRQAHGYSVMVATDEHPWFAPGTVMKGHEFHHSKVIATDSNLRYVFKNERGKGIDGTRDGICYKGVIATYTHVNALASPLWAKELVKQAHRFLKTR
jgi:cobyrinic acid a,c-diamide synthase